MYTNPFMELFTWAASFVGASDYISQSAEFENIFRNALFFLMTLWCCNLGKFSMCVVAPFAVANKLGFLNVLAENDSFNSLFTYSAFSAYCTFVSIIMNGQGIFYLDSLTPQARKRARRRSSVGEVDLAQAAKCSKNGEGEGGVKSPTKSSTMSPKTMNAVEAARLEQARRVEERIANLGKKH